MRCAQPPRALLPRLPQLGCHSRQRRCSRLVWRRAATDAAAFAPPPTRRRPTPAPELLDGYNATLTALRQELDSTRAGDTATLLTYVLESGASSQALLASLRAAAARGVRLRIGCDRSPLSKLTRWFEGADTLADALDQLAADYGNVQPLPLSGVPNHSKFLIVKRRAGRGAHDSAVFGGINIGDRFTHWRDFAVRLRGAEASAALGQAILSGGTSCLSDAPGGLQFSSNAPIAFCPLAFALRWPLPGRFGVADALRSFYDDPSLCRYVVAAAYVDDAGAALLRRALDRGARVTLMLPAVPNVYPHANAATLRSLLQHPGAFSALLHPRMVHAKAAVGFREDGTPVAVIGSANLKCRSLTQFGELLMRCDGGHFAQRLASALASLAAECDAVRHAPRQVEDPTAQWVARGMHACWAALTGGAAEAVDEWPGAAPALRYVPAIAAVEEWMG